MQHDDREIRISDGATPFIIIHRYIPIEKVVCFLFVNVHLICVADTDRRKREQGEANKRQRYCF